MSGEADALDDMVPLFQYLTLSMTPISENNDQLIISPPYVDESQLGTVITAMLPVFWRPKCENGVLADNPQLYGIVAKDIILRDSGIFGLTSETIKSFIEDDLSQKRECNGPYVYDHCSMQVIFTIKIYVNPGFLL